MALPVARPAGCESELKITAGANLVPGQVLSAFGGYAGIVQGTQNIVSGQPAVLAIEGKWEIDCASGTTASAGDPAYFNTSTNLVVTAGGANIIWIGVFAHAKTSGQTKATILLNEESNANFPYIPAATAQSLSGAGAINVTSFLTKWTTTGANAGTLADGVRVGQLKKIQLIVDGGDGTLTPTTLSGGTTITFADAGDFVLLVWTASGWVVLEAGNDADGATAPVVA